MHARPAPKILILESQMIIAADVYLQFLKLGYEVIGINTCFEDALKTIERNRPDIVLMNIDLPGEATRLRAARILLESFQIPAVLLSTGIDMEMFEGLKAVQPYAVVTKPFDSQGLQSGIETALHRMAAEGLWRKKMKCN